MTDSCDASVGSCTVQLPCLQRARSHFPGPIHLLERVLGCTLSELWMAAVSQSLALSNAPALLSGLHTERDLDVVVPVEMAAAISSVHNATIKTAIEQYFHEPQGIAHFWSPTVQRWLSTRIRVVLESGYKFTEVTGFTFFTDMDSLSQYNCTSFLINRKPSKTWRTAP
jgi:hypothetical protein